MRHERYISIGIAVITGFTVVVPALAAAKPAVIPISATYGKVTAITKSNVFMTVGKTLYAVKLEPGTVYQNAKARNRTITEIVVGNKIWVWGRKTTTKLSITGVSKVKDMSASK